jgi:hypothetical protein
MKNRFHNSIEDLRILAIENNLNHFYEKCAKYPDCISQIDDRIGWILSKNEAWPSLIFRADFSGLEIENEVRSIKKLIKDKRMPRYWTVSPSTNPKDLIKYLEMNGFKKFYVQIGMAMNLDELKFAAKNPNLEIRIVKDKLDIKNWCKNVAEVFNIKVDCELIEFLNFQNNPKFYLGVFNNQVVSTLMLSYSVETAGLHSVTTLPKYRRMGFSLSMSNKALLDAKKKGCKIGVLQASLMGRKVYEKLGFEKYCIINSYNLG